MIKKSTIFDFLTHIMVVWGISVLSLCVFCFLFGESARGMSSLFELGNAGISIGTLLQFFLLAMVITALRWLFFSDKLIKQLGMLFRTTFMFMGVIIAVGILAAVFEWLPVNEVKSWTMFLFSFLICAIVSICVSASKEKIENKKLQDALERLKEEEY